MPALLALETSCDETAASLCTLEGKILSSRLFSQIAIHRCEAERVLVGPQPAVADFYCMVTTKTVMSPA